MLNIDPIAIRFPVPPVVPPDAVKDAAVVAAPARGGPDDPLAEKLRHCPVAVAGSTTALQDTDDGIALTITAPGTAAATGIRRRAAHLVAFTAGQAKRTEQGGGGGGGFMQNCPVVTRATSITATDVTGGSRLDVHPIGSLTADVLRTETRRRRAAFAP